ncbi:hypothetical protein QTP88_003058 [Uroleucon formosanum]
MITIEAQYFDITFVNGHTPTEEKTSTIGIHSLHDITSENGLRLIDFASGGGLIVKSMMLPHKDIYKGTWKTPNGRYVSQIDHVLINTRFKNCVYDVKTVRGADCDSDHYLVKGKLKVKLKKLIQSKGTLVDRFDVNKLKDTNTCELFKQQLYETMNSLNINQEETIDTKWKVLKDAIKTFTDAVIGKQKRTRKPWFDNYCKEAFNRRKEARTQLLNDPTNKEKATIYKESQK